MKAYVCVIFSFAFFLRIPLCNFVVSYICIASFVNQVGAGKKERIIFLNRVLEILIYLCLLMTRKIKKN